MTISDRITTYIGTYTRRESFVDGKAEGIYIYHLDPSSGALTYAATVPAPVRSTLRDCRQCECKQAPLVQSGSKSGCIGPDVVEPLDHPP